MGPEPEGALQLEVERLRQQVAELQQRLAAARPDAAGPRPEDASSTLAQIAGELAETLDFTRAAQRIVSAVLKVLGGRRANLFRLDGDGDSMVCIASTDPSAASWMGRPLPITGLSGIVLREGRAVWIADVLDDPRIQVGDATRRQIESHGLRAAAATPLRARGELIGSLVLLDELGRRFTEAELTLLSAVGDQAGLALDNARLYTVAEHGRRAAEVLAEIGRTLSQTLDPEVVARRVVDSLRDLLHARSAAVYLLEPGADRLVKQISSQEAEGTFSWSRVLEGGTGVVGMALATGAPVAVPDVLADPRVVYDDDLRSRVARASVRAVLAVPLRSPGRTLGALVVGDTTGRTFRPAEIELAEAFARQAALALDNALVHEETTRRRREAEELAHIARLASETLDLAAVGERIAERVLTLLDVHSSAIRLVRRDGTLAMIASGGRARDYGGVGDDVPAGIGIVGRAAAEGRAVWTEDIRRDERFEITEEMRRRNTSASIIAGLAVPLRVAGGVIGVLSVGSEVPRRFTDSDVALLQTCADHAALALDNARLFGAEDERRREAEVLADVAGTLNAALDLDVVLHRVTEAAQELCRSDVGRIALVEAAGTSMAFRYAVGLRHGRYEDLSIEPGRGLGGMAWARAEPFRTEHAAGAPGLGDAERAMLAREGIAVSLVVPIRAGGTVEGLIHVDNRSARAFTERDEAMLLRLADHAAIAIRNARLFTAEQSARAEAEAAARALQEAGEQLRQAQKMEAVGRLAGGIAHDFNNLLTVILGRVVLLLARPGIDSALRRDLDLIRNTAERAASLTQQLLAFSRKQVLQPEVLDLAAAVRDLDPMLRRLIGEDIEFAVQIPGTALWVQADPGQLHQVILNLAVNARDAMPSGGRLTIRVDAVTVPGRLAPASDEMPAGSYAMLSVRDTGVGMDADTLAHLFEPFFTTKEVGKGTGLGLATVYGIVSQSGGQIRVDSTPGLGTVFRIYLPAVRPGGAHADARPGERRAGSETVLIVEDETAVRALVREILELSGYAVLEARGPHEAIELLARRREPVQLVVTDVVMPEMSGRELVERLGRISHDMPVLYMSGYTDNELGRRGVLESTTAFLHKPFTPDGLCRKVREVLDASRGRRPG